MNAPKKYMWFVQSTGFGPAKEGSAVAIRLRKIGQPQSAETFLLTCAHVVRGESKEGLSGYGDLLKIQVWPPDVGFHPDEACVATVAFDMAQNLPQDSSNVADDWIVLKIAKAQAASAAMGVRNWGGLSNFQHVRIHGYIGRESLPNSKVIPTMTEQFPFRSESQGELCLHGDGTRPGISGGGLFTDGTGDFVGIHRARVDDILQLRAISADHIKRRLFELGYEPAIQNENPYSEAFAQFKKLWQERPQKVDWAGAFANAKPATSTFDFPNEANSDADRALSAIDYLIELGPEQGIPPLIRFAYLLSGSTNDASFGMLLNNWLGKYCSAMEQELADRSSPLPSEDPRIVIQMSRHAEDLDSGLQDDTTVHSSAIGEMRPLAGVGAIENAATDAPKFRYTTWFLGFPQTPPPETRIGTCESFPVVLESAWSKVRDLLDFRKVLVELFLPKELFPWAVEKQQIRISTFSFAVGTQHPFALRYDRKAAARLLESRLESAENRSKKLASTIKLNCETALEDIPDDAIEGEEYFFVSVGTTIDPAELNLMLDCKNRILGVIWESAPEVRNGNGAPDAWDAAIESGVPLIMWVREPPPVADDKADLRKLFQSKEWQSLPDQVKKLRSEAAHQKAKWHVGRHLAVILDHPKRPLPTASRAARFRSPNSRLS
jgi:vWA-MoxR associated protein C-terminal domain